MFKLVSVVLVYRPKGRYETGMFRSHSTIAFSYKV